MSRGKSSYGGNTAAIHVNILPTTPATPNRREQVKTEDERHEGSFKGPPTPASPPRARPRCRHCHELRLGHPRSGCPNVDPPIPPKNSRTTPIYISIQQTVNNFFNCTPGEYEQDAGSRPFTTRTSSTTYRATSHKGTMMVEPQALASSLMALQLEPLRQHVVQGKTLARRIKNLRSFRRVHASPVYLMHVPVDELDDELEAAAGLGLEAKELSPRTGWVDRTKGIVIVGELSQDVDAYARFVRAEARKGTSFKGMVESLEFEWTLHDGVPTAWEPM